MCSSIVSTISNSQVYLLNNVSSFCKLLTFFSKNISVYAIGTRVMDIFFRICRNSRTTGINPHQSVPSVTSQSVSSSQTGNSVEMYRII